MGPTQDLQQKVCQKYGWSLMYSKNDTNGYWRADIVTGWNSTKTFLTEESLEGGKEGKAAVSVLALQGLTSEIAHQESLPAKELSQVFQSTISQLELLDSQNPRTWERFWKDPPKAVGIDTEGNSISPPVLVQISTLEFCILETPQTTLSLNLQRLLQDDAITKVFCDNFGHKDKIALGLLVQKEKDPELYMRPPIVDLESLAAKHLGPVSTARGLGKIVSMTMPELQVRIEKPLNGKQGMKGRFTNISRFVLIEQGKAKPLRSMNNLSLKEQQYAALDAWCTLAVYVRLQNIK